MTAPNSMPVTPVPLGTGPPTKEEMVAYYPGKFTWKQMKMFVNSGDLGLLKRDKTLQERYMIWTKGIKQQHGSMVNYLYNHRLQWGKHDTLSVLSSALDSQHDLLSESEPTATITSAPGELPTLPSDAPPYFTSTTPREYISIIQNDWPYSVPSDVEHTLIWTRVPIFHPATVDERVSARVAQDGIWGFTGETSPPPSPSTLPLCLPALSDWGVTLDKMIVSEQGTDEENALVVNAGREVHEFVKNRWIESEWETAWFVNPPRLQSVPGLAHIHVFARQKI